MSEAQIGEVAVDSKQNSEELRERRIANLKPHRFPKGKSGNPLGGKLHKKPLSAAYAEVLEQKCPTDKQGRTWAQVIAAGQAEAARSGKTDAAREIGDRTEGKVKEKLDITGEVNFSLSERIAKARQRDA